MTTLKVDPAPFVLCTSILPPYSETVVLLMARLRPTPFSLAWGEPGGAHSPFAEKNGEKIRGMSSSGMPQPESSTSKYAASFVLPVLTLTIRTGRSRSESSALPIRLESTNFRRDFVALDSWGLGKVEHELDLLLLDPLLIEWKQASRQDIESDVFEDAGRFGQGQEAIGDVHRLLHACRVPPPRRWRVGSAVFFRTSCRSR